MFKLITDYKDIEQVAKKYPEFFPKDAKEFVGKKYEIYMRNGVYIPCWIDDQYKCLALALIIEREHCSFIPITRFKKLMCKRMEDKDLKGFMAFTNNMKVRRLLTKHLHFEYLANTWFVLWKHNFNKLKEVNNGR